MDQNLTAIERAFQIAHSGEVQTHYEIKKLLKAEGYSLDPITGRNLLKQLRKLIDLVASARTA